MLERCAEAVRAAGAKAGQTVTAAQLREIEDRISRTMRRMARTDEGWTSRTYDERLQLAAQEAAADIAAEAARAANLKTAQIVKQAEAGARVAGLQESFKGPQALAARRDFELTHMVQRQMLRDAAGDLMTLTEAAGDRTGTGLGRRFLMMAFDAENPAMTRDILREVYARADGHTGNEVAKAAAESWLSTIEKLRARFNAAGGDVGELDYGYVPQPHDGAKIRRAGRDAWADATLPLLDRSRYLNEDGSRMSDEAVRDLLRQAWSTITTDGLNKSEPGVFKGTGKRANRGSESREIHFADGDAWAEYMRQFGRGTVYDAMMRHIGGITRDIALVERYGPDPHATARLMLDLAERADGGGVGALTVEPRTFWRMITGEVGSPANEQLSQVFSTVRHVMVAAKLGKAVVQSFADVGTVYTTAGYNRLPIWQVVKDLCRSKASEAQELMGSHGMIAESAIDALNRWSADNMGGGWSGKLANSVLRWSLLTAWTDGLKQGFILSMNAKLAQLTRVEWGALTEFDRVRLERAGITGDDWGKLNGVGLDHWRGRDIITPQAIRDAGHGDLAERVFAFVHDEADAAVTSPDLRTRAITTWGGTQAGTPAGEIARTAMQFKAFPIAMMSRHWGRLIGGDLGAEGAPLMANRVAYGSALMVTLAGLGALSVQAVQVLAGKEPINMDPTDEVGRRFWLKAVTTGGGLAILGDLFLVDPSNGAGDAAAKLAKNIAGPAFGSAAELLFKDIVENLWQAAKGKDTHWQAELLTWLQANTPGGNIWWVKPLVDHMVMNGVNESLSPGYLARVKERAWQEWEQRYWWNP